jgi:hypothetical protein
LRLARVWLSLHVTCNLDARAVHLVSLYNPTRRNLAAPLYRRPAQISHGVIESSSQLSYAYSFGGLNEATADIMSGALITDSAAVT